MIRHELILAALAPAQGAPHTPVQVQKLFFLIDKNIASQVDGPHFNFEPYHYGPFDPMVYEELSKLAKEKYVDIDVGKWKSYRLTVLGQRKGDEVLANIEQEAADYIRKVSNFVRSVSFTQLVASIYKKYPEMREKSVFQG